ncbi:tetratricopeptide repeat protein [Lichenicoccus roseus]|uniref:Sel1 repeat family protein n=1 Tax=Lichenicoccus roseus TaxID=2683649 RepID=A0A5R9JBC1_9PROT|nr:sel1 repeat family protein [Lichenicoccus roseus]
MRRRLFVVVLVVFEVSSASTTALADANASTPVPELITFAQRGDAAAEYQLGQRYRLGRGLQQSYPAALHWYLRSSDQGFTPAEDRVAIMYMNGRDGLPKDEASGLQLWEKAASQGDFAAKIMTWLYHSRIYNGMRALPLTVRRMILLMIILPFVVAVMTAFLLCVFGFRRLLHRSKTQAAPQ